MNINISLALKITIILRVVRLIMGRWGVQVTEAYIIAKPRKILTVLPTNPASTSMLVNPGQRIARTMNVR